MSQANISSETVAWKQLIRELQRIADALEKLNNRGSWD